MTNHQFFLANCHIITYNKVISHSIISLFVSIDLITIIFNYSIIPFASTLFISILALNGYNRLKFKNFHNHRSELKMYDMEKEARIQNHKTELILDQFNVIYERINKTDEKINKIQNLIKLMDERLIESPQNIKSQYSVVPPMQYYVTNSNNNPSPPNHGIKSQNVLEPTEQSDERQNGTIEYILKKLKDNSLTTREIQKVVGRTREHTSRLMKKLYEDKLVDRDMSTKPFRYTITDEGRKRLSKHSALETHPRFGSPKIENALN